MAAAASWKEAGKNWSQRSSGKDRGSETERRETRDMEVKGNFRVTAAGKSSILPL